MHVIVIYRNPDGNSQSLMNFLSVTLNNLDLQHTELYILGDFNIEDSNKAILRRSNLSLLETTYNLKQAIRTPTRITPSSISLIDIAFTNTDCLAGAGSLNINMSDHLPVYVIRKKPRHRISRKMVTGRSYRQYNRDMFVAFLLNCNWQERDSSSDPDTLWDVFELNICESLDKICPMKQIKVPITRPKWVTNEIVSLMRDRDKMFSHARRTNNQDSWTMARFLRNRVEMAII